MILVVQRVRSAEVQIGEELVGRIGKGVLVLLGVEKGDTQQECAVLFRKLLALRIFEGRTPMDLTLKQVQGACLVVSQFTLVGNLSKGNRPSFDRAELPDAAKALYEAFVDSLRGEGLPTETGRFGADMIVRLENDGPVTFILEAKDGKLIG